MRPQLQLPALTRFVDGTGPIFAGKVFPFCFITIACGAISGFHSLISSGTTPKLLRRGDRRADDRLRRMLLESFVAIMAMVAAAALQPGVYFAINSPAGVVGRRPGRGDRHHLELGLPGDAGADGDAGARDRRAHAVRAHRRRAEPRGRHGDTSSRACSAETALALWYHFAIMFEALFILTTLDAGTRVGRFMLQDLLGHLWEPLGRTSWYPSVLLASLVVVGSWGYFLYQGVIDPLGGINILWPLFGIANQLLAAIALVVATTHHHPDGPRPLRLDDAAAARLAAGGDDDRRLPEDPVRRSEARLPRRGRISSRARSADGPVAAEKIAQTRSADLQPAPRRRRHRRCSWRWSR